MKRVIIICSALLTSFSLFSQTEFDAVRFIQSDITGSARYSSMAGAFGALGGDPSAIKDNPAGLGIYRSSELSVGFNSLNQSTNANWNSKESNDVMNRLGFNNLSYIFSTETSKNTQRNSGLMRSNWAFNFNRLRDFNREMKINGGVGSSSSITDYMAYFTGNINGGSLYSTNTYDPFNNPSVPWISVLAAEAGLMVEYVDSETGNTVYWESLLDPGEKVNPNYRRIESGFHDAYSFSWSGNFNNRFFVGATVNFHDFSYSASSDYTEAFENGGSMGLYNVYKSSATGYNFDLGAIFIPFNAIRLGASIKTPMVYNVTDFHYADMAYNYGGNNTGTILTPNGDNRYKLQTPAVYSLSGSLILGKSAVIGLEYVYNNYSETRFMNTSNDMAPFRYENDGIKANFLDQRMRKLGAEFKITPNLAVRGGIANSGPVTRNTLAKEMIPNTIRTDVDYFIHNSTNYLTAGIGYRDRNWYFDLAFMNKTINESFYAYNSNNLSESLRLRPATVATHNQSLIATVGLRF